MLVNVTSAALIHHSYRYLPKQTFLNKSSVLDHNGTIKPLKMNRSYQRPINQASVLGTPISLKRQYIWSGLMLCSIEGFILIPLVSMK